MKRNKKHIAILSLLTAFTLCGGTLSACAAKKEEAFVPPVDIEEEEGGDTNFSQEPGISENEPAEEVTKPNTGAPEFAQPEEKKAEYICVNVSGVNLRAGAGTDYACVGTAEEGTLYIYCGRTGNWYKTYYKNRTVYISAKYCTIVQMDKSANSEIEDVIAEGCKYMGVKYVYGATRYHNGSGKLLSGFTTTAFDCSSLMQYIFKMGAGINLQVNTRTQIYQGTTVKKSALKRGDLIFFTNASRKNNTGIERVGHVALYLGDNYILHTASDYAKIEQISSTRWGYYIQTQRML